MYESFGLVGAAGGHGQDTLFHPCFVLHPLAVNPLMLIVRSYEK